MIAQVVQGVVQGCFGALQRHRVGANRAGLHGDPRRRSGASAAEIKRALGDGQLHGVGGAVESIGVGERDRARAFEWRPHILVDHDRRTRQGDHRRIVLIGSCHVDGDARHVERVVRGGAILVQRAAVGARGQIPAAITQAVIDRDFDLQIGQISIGTSGFGLHQVQRGLHTGQRALKYQGVVASGVGDRDTGGKNTLELQHAIVVSRIGTGQELDRHLHKVDFRPLQTVSQVFIAQREVGEILRSRGRIHDKQAAETGGNGGLVVRADKLDGVAGRRDDRALHKGGAVVRSVLVGPKIAIAHGVFKEVLGLVFGAAVLVLDLQSVELGLGEHRAHTQRAAVGGHGAKLRGCGHAVLALLAGVITVLVDQVGNGGSGRSRGATARAIRAAGVASGSLDNERAALRQKRHASVARLGLANIGGRVVQRVDVDGDLLLDAAADLVGRVDCWQSACTGGCDVLIVQGDNFEAVGIVLAAVVHILQFARIKVGFCDHLVERHSRAIEQQLPLRRQCRHLETQNIVCRKTVGFVA